MYCEYVGWVRYFSFFFFSFFQALCNVYMYKTINTYAYSPTVTHKMKLTKCESEFECNFPYFDKTCPNIVTQKKMVLLMVSNYISHLCKSKSNPLTVVMFYHPIKSSLCSFRFCTLNFRVAFYRSYLETYLHVLYVNILALDVNDTV